MFLYINNMKFIITSAELTNIIRERFNLPEGVKVVISRSTTRSTKESSASVKLKSLIDKTFKQFPRHASNEKISAIKFLREESAKLGMVVGLAEAKYAVENPDSAVANMESRGLIY
jgi:ribosomal protein L7/L12